MLKLQSINLSKFRNFRIPPVVQKEFQMALKKFTVNILRLLHFIAFEKLAKWITFVT